MRLVLIILTSAVVILMIWSFARNAIALKRDVDQRFDRFRRRLETDATEAIEPLLQDKSGQNGSKST